MYYAVLYNTTVYYIYVRYVRAVYTLRLWIFCIRSVHHAVVCIAPRFSAFFNNLIVHMMVIAPPRPCIRGIYTCNASAYRPIESEKKRQEHIICVYIWRAILERTTMRTHTVTAACTTKSINRPTSTIIPFSSIHLLALCGTFACVAVCERIHIHMHDRHPMHVCMLARLCVREYNKKT